MLESLMNMLTSGVGPSHATVGEAYILHQTLAAFYFLRVKGRLYEEHCQSPDLRAWFKDASETVERRIGILEAHLEKRGIPSPPTFPMTTELTDQFMATDAVAMVTGMLQADLIGLQAARHPDVVMLYRSLIDEALYHGAKLTPVIVKEGWIILTPAYETQMRT